MQAARRTSSLACSAVLAAAVSGCAHGESVRGDAFDAAFAKGERAESAGRWTEAGAAYDEAAEAARRGRDRGQATWDAALMLVRTGRLSEALARLDAIAAGGGEHAPEAGLRAGILRIERGDPDAGCAQLREVAIHYPSHGVAHRAVQRLVQRARETGGSRGALRELQALEAAAGGTELGQLLAYLTARELETLGDVEPALAAYRRIADRWPYPSGSFFDDALWHASLLDEELGRVRGAIDDLERMVRERETTFLVGTYERARYVPAVLRIGALWQSLHEPTRARAAYDRLYRDFRNSTSRDDALWLEAESWRQEGQSGRACELLSTLIREFPDSRYVPCAVARCGSLGRSPGSVAPQECHPYIERPPALAIEPPVEAAAR
jgi:tetratricopeptide (TPR) repeat protein